MAKDILVIDSDFKNYRRIQASLQDVSTNVYYAATMQDGIKEMMKHDFCLIIIDVFLSSGCGQTLIGAIRAKIPAPMIVLSGQFSTDDNVLARQSVPYDFISKKYEIEECLARTQALMWRHYELNHIIQHSYAIVGPEGEGIMIDTERRLVIMQGNEVELTQKEYEILVYLFKNRNIVLTYTQIYLAVWHEDYLGDSDTISFHICKLRKKLCNGFIIQSIRGIGYRLKLKVS